MERYHSHLTIIMNIAICILIVFIFVTLVEYVYHRWLMHNIGTSYYLLHAIEHHIYGMHEGRHMDLTLWHSLYFYVGTVLLWFPLSYLWEWFPLVWALFLVWWSFAWSSCHRLIHNDQRYWYARILCPWYWLVARHHIAHHDQPNRNFGALFIWSDRFFCTLAVK